ncbi:MAG TPA: hypothetical protein VMW91_10955 [Desulfosporosinus sp.]|nr:hypothetical protein [Desulfosporosinus sp.]
MAPLGAGPVKAFLFLGQKTTRLVTRKRTLCMDMVLEYFSIYRACRARLGVFRDHYHKNRRIKIPYLPRFIANVVMLKFCLIPTNGGKKIMPMCK